MKERPCRRHDSHGNAAGMVALAIIYLLFKKFGGA